MGYFGFILGNTEVKMAIAFSKESKRFGLNIRIT